MAVLSLAVILSIGIISIIMIHNSCVNFLPGGSLSSERVELNQRVAGQSNDGLATIIDHFARSSSSEKSN